MLRISQKSNNLVVFLLTIFTIIVIISSFSKNVFADGNNDWKFFLSNGFTIEKSSNFNVIGCIAPTDNEPCDGYDNDCDGIIDEGCVQRYYYYDSDQDGWGVCEKYIYSAIPVGKYNAIKCGDCDDTNDNINPDKAEIPGNDNDENCDGVAEMPVKLKFDSVKNDWPTISINDLQNQYFSKCYGNDENSGLYDKINGLVVSNDHLKNKLCLDPSDSNCKPFTFCANLGGKIDIQTRLNEVKGSNQFIIYNFWNMVGKNSTSDIYFFMDDLLTLGGGESNFDETKFNMRLDGITSLRAFINFSILYPDPEDSNKAIICRRSESWISTKLITIDGIQFQLACYHGVLKLLGWPPGMSGGLSSSCYNLNNFDAVPQDDGTLYLNYLPPGIPFYTQNQNNLRFVKIIFKDGKSFTPPNDVLSTSVPEIEKIQISDSSDVDEDLSGYACVYHGHLKGLSFFSGRSYLPTGNTDNMCCGNNYSDDYTYFVGHKSSDYSGFTPILCFQGLLFLASNAYEYGTLTNVNLDDYVYNGAYFDINAQRIIYAGKLDLSKDDIQIMEDYKGYPLNALPVVFKDSGEFKVKLFVCSKNDVSFSGQLQNYVEVKHDEDMVVIRKDSENTRIITLNVTGNYPSRYNSVVASFVCLDGEWRLNSELTHDNHLVRFRLSKYLSFLNQSFFFVESPKNHSFPMEDYSLNEYGGAHNIDELNKSINISIETQNINLISNANILINTSSNNVKNCDGIGQLALKKFGLDFDIYNLVLCNDFNYSFITFKAKSYYPTSYINRRGHLIYHILPEKYGILSNLPTLDVDIKKTTYRIGNVNVQIKP